MSNTQYTKELKLYHHERAAVYNTHSKEFKQVNTKFGNPDFTYHNKDEVFKKFYGRAWKLLETQTNERELLVAYKLAMMARAYTNSLSPLSPESTSLLLAETLGVDRRYVTKIINKLFNLGVIGKFEVAETLNMSDEPELHKYWIFNPYLAFNGKVIDKDISALFKNTIYAQFKA